MNEVRPQRLMTPAYPFAKDYARGPLRVLFFVQGRTAPREVAELHQRFNVAQGAFLFHGLNEITDDGNIWLQAIGGTSMTEKLDELYGLLEQRWDAIVFGANFRSHFPPRLTSLPAKAQYLILEQVANGTGLLLIGNTKREKKLTDLLHRPAEADPFDVLAGVPFTQLRTYAEVTRQPLDELPGLLLKTYRFGKGRVAVMPHFSMAGVEGTWAGFHALTPAFGYTPPESVYYDYYHSIVAKTLLWLVPLKASPIAMIRPRDAMGSTRTWGDLPCKLDVASFALPDGARITATLQLRDPHGHVTPLPDQRLNPPRAQLVVDLPSLGAGDYFIDYRLTCEKGTEYWGSHGLTVTDPPARIAEVRVSQPIFERDGAMQATVELAGELAGGKLVLAARGVDLDGRVVFRQAVEVRDKAVQLSGPLLRARVIPHRLELELRRDGKPLASRQADFFVRRPDPPFPNVIWGQPIRSILGEIQARQLRRAEVNVVISGGPVDAARRDMLFLPFAIHLRTPTREVTDKDPDPGFANPQWVKALFQKEVAPVVEKAKPYGVFAYNLGDENNYSYNRTTVAPSEAKAFRQFVKQRYGGDLELLNREWGTDYVSFDAIEIKDANALTTIQQIPQKTAWMAWCQRLYADAHHTLARGIRQLHPGARVGFEGSPPGNAEWTLEGLDMWGPYPSDMGNALMRSFTEPHTIRGNWWGGYVAKRLAGAQPLWEQVLSGAVNSSFYFTIEGAEGLLGGDAAFAEYFTETQLPAIREVSDTVGPLLSRGRVAPMGLGLLYSPASDHVLTVDDRFGWPGAAANGLLKFFADRGVSVFFYSPRQILRGKLKKDGVRLLVLPQAVVMSDELAAALGRWVESGGTLLADQQPAVRNERGALRSAGGALDSLMGVRQQPPAQPRTVDVAGRIGDLDVQWPGMTVNAGVKVTDAQPGLAADGVPLILTRDTGKGRTILLNTPMHLLLARKDAAFAALLEGYFVQAGGSLPARMPAGYRCTWFQGDGYRLVSFRLDSDARPGQAVRLAAPAFVYDVRHGKALGRREEIVPTEHAPRNTLFALFDAQPAGPVLEFPAQGRPADMLSGTVRFASDHDSGPARVVRVRVRDPQQQELRSLREFHDARRDQIRFVIPLAYNQTPGRYTVEVCDLATGQSATAAFLVKER